MQSEPNSQQNQLQSQQKPQQNEQMTPELAKELVQLMKDSKVQVRYGSLNAILQYTKSEEAKLLFLETDLFKSIIETLQNPQLHKICLSTLIHFSSNEKCAQKLVDFIKPIVLDLRTSQGLPQQLGLLLLLNVSKVYEFTAKLVSKKEGQATQTFSQQYGLLLEIIYSLMDSKPSRRWVIANIFVNVSSHDIGREYIAKGKLYLGFLKYINDDKESLRLAVLRIIRNVAFLWQNDEIVTQILKKQHHLIDHIAIHILIMVIKSKLVQDWQNAVTLLKESGYNNILDYDMQIEPDLPKINTTKQKSINEIEVCVDILIILSNSDFPTRKPQFLKDELKKVISITTFSPISQEAKDKLEALETFCFW